MCLKIGTIMQATAGQPRLPFERYYFPLLTEWIVHFQKKSYLADHEECNETYIIGICKPSVRIIDLVSHTTCVVCINLHIYIIACLTQLFSLLITNATVLLELHTQLIIRLLELQLTD